MIARDAGGNERHALFAVGADGSGRAAALGRPRRDPRARRILARRDAGRVHAHGPQRRRLRRRDRARRRRRAPRAGAAGRLVARRRLVGARHPRAAREHAVRPRPLPRRPTTAARWRISRRTTARSPTTRRACCPTAPCCAPAMPAASSRGSRCCAPAPGPSCSRPTTATSSCVALDASRTRRAWAVNRGGESEVWLDGARLEGLPGGVVSALAFAPGGALTVTAGPPDDSTDVWTRRAAAVARRTRSAVGGLDRAADSCGRCSTRSRASTAAASRTCASAPPGDPRCAGCTAGPESQFRPQMAPVIQYLCAQGITVAAPNVRGSTGYGRTYHHLDDVERRLDSVADLAALGQALGAGSRRPGRRDGRLLRRLHDDGGDHRAPRALGLRREHRRHRQLRHLPRAHGRLPPRAARGRVRLARARPRVPRVDLADPQDRSHRLPAHGDPRRQRPARAGGRGRAGRRGPAGARVPPSSTCATRTRATASRACPTASTATRAWPRSCSGICSDLPEPATLRECSFEADLEAARRPHRRRGRADARMAQRRARRGARVRCLAEVRAAAAHGLVQAARRDQRRARAARRDARRGGRVERQPRAGGRLRRARRGPAR